VAVGGGSGEGEIITASAIYASEYKINSIFSLGIILLGELLNPKRSQGRAFL
jgi:hypothetical protein